MNERERLHLRYGVRNHGVQRASARGEKDRRELGKMWWDLERATASPADMRRVTERENDDDET